MSTLKFNLQAIKAMPPAMQAAVFNALSPAELALLSTDWGFIGRSEQNFWLYDEDYISILYLTGRGWGKMAVNSTPIVTPDGWVQMGDLSVGDSIFDESGRICHVTGVFPQPLGHERQYRVHFSDGTSIVAGESHLWSTWTHRDRKQFLRNAERDGYDPRFFPPEWPEWRGPDHFVDQHGHKRPVDPPGPRVRSTLDILKTLRQENTARKDLNHSIPVAFPLECCAVPTLIDPWILGYWLGNGESTHGTLCSGSKDGEFDWPEVHERCLQSFPYASMWINQGRGNATHNLKVEFLNRLVNLDLVRNKHIPARYLRGSIHQRKQLLAGLMDSDGHMGSNQHVEFCTILPHLAEQVLELVRSLGERPVLYEGRAKLNGKDYGAKYRVVWRPSLFNPFTLKRKARGFVKPDAQCLRLRHRMITAIEEVPVSPATCITVDSPHRLFLAGEAMIPTHNTRTGAEWVYHMASMGYGEYGTIVAPTNADLKEVLIEGPSGILAVCDAKKDFSPAYNKQTGIIAFPNGVKIRSISAETPDRIRGSNSTFAYIDEIAAAPQAREALDMLLFANRIPGKNGGRPKFLYTTTPKPTQVIIDLVKEAKADPKLHKLVSGSIFENAANLSQSALDKVKELEGTRLYRQEALGEVIDLSEQGIIKRSQFKLWPHNQKVPALRYLIASYDTAYTQRQVDKKTMSTDPSACTIWGLVRGPDSDGNYGKGPYVALLFDVWEEWLGFPELKARLRKDAKTKWGEEGRPTDLLLIEDKGSGRSIRQELELEGIFARGYSPGLDDKLTRLHGVTPLFAAGRVYVPESSKRPGEPMAWVEPLIEQMTTFPFAAHDDMTDTVSQALTYLRDVGALSAAPPKETDEIKVGDDQRIPTSTRVEVSNTANPYSPPEDDPDHTPIRYGRSRIRIGGTRKNPYAS